MEAVFPIKCTASRAPPIRFMMVMKLSQSAIAAGSASPEEFVSVAFAMPGGSGVGWWFSVVGQMLPWIFAVLQISLPTTSGGLSSPAANFGNNAIFLIIVNVVMWVFNATLHVIMAPRLVCHINSKPEMIKRCPLKRRVGMSELEYQDACRKIFVAVKEKKASSGVGDDDLPVAAI